MWVGLVTAVRLSGFLEIRTGSDPTQKQASQHYLSIGYHSLLAIPGVDYRESVKVVLWWQSKPQIIQADDRHDWVNPSCLSLKVLLPSFEIKGAYLDALQACRDTIMLWNSARDFWTSFLCSTLSTNVHALLFGNQGLAS